MDNINNLIKRRTESDAQAVNLKDSGTLFLFLNTRATSFFNPTTISNFYSGNLLVPSKKT